MADQQQDQPKEIPWNYRAPVELHYRAEDWIEAQIRKRGTGYSMNMLVTEALTEKLDREGAPPFDPDKPRRRGRGRRS